MDRVMPNLMATARSVSPDLFQCATMAARNSAIAGESLLYAMVRFIVNDRPLCPLVRGERSSHRGRAIWIAVEEQQFIKAGENLFGPHDLRLVLAGQPDVIRRHFGAFHDALGR